MAGAPAGTGTTFDDPGILGGERELITPIFFPEPLASSGVARGVFAISPLINVPELESPDVFTVPLVTFSNAGALDNVGNIQIAFSANPDLFENTTSFADLEEIRLVPEPGGAAGAGAAAVSILGIARRRRAGTPGWTGAAGRPRRLRTSR